MVDAAGTTKYTDTVAGRLFTEDGPWSNDTATNTWNNRLRVGMDLQQPTGVWTNAGRPPRLCHSVDAPAASKAEAAQEYWPPQSAACQS